MHRHTLETPHISSEAKNKAPNSEGIEAQVQKPRSVRPRI